MHRPSEMVVRDSRKAAHEAQNTPSARERRAFVSSETINRHHAPKLNTTRGSARNRGHMKHFDLPPLNTEPIGELPDFL